MKTSDRSGRVHVIATVLILAAATIGFAVGYFEYNKPATTQEGMSLTMLGLANPVLNRLNERFTDEDGDLVADAPGDPAAWLDPEVLLFSYVAAEQGDEQSETVWKQFVEHLAAQTGKKAEYVRFSDTKEQLLALKNGKLHVAGLNTGNVPLSVNDCGFVPVCTFGDDQGMMEYVMNIIVPTQSPLQSVSDLQNHTLALTHPDSNSGFKAPLVILMNDFGMQVERDYLIQVTRSHDASIKGVADETYEAAAVASDMVTRAISRGDAKQEQLRVIYESERFANAALGYVYNLNPDLAKQITDAMFSFAWEGTGVGEEFSSLGADRFVPIDYKNDWALIRRIDDAMGNPHVVTEEASLPESAEAESI